MKRVAGVLALMLMVSLLAASDVPGFALIGAGKTVGPSLTATIVTHVTRGGAQRGLTSVRVQKASQSAAVLFTSGYVLTLKDGSALDQTCISNNPDEFPLITGFRFAGCNGGCLVDGWIDDPVALQALLGGPQFGNQNPNKAAILDTDYASCTTEGTGASARQILSFTAVIQFQP
jgi:hypothetical protein